MSYSRWSHSRWYTYYSASSGETRDTQMFCVDAWDFSYKALKNNLKDCIEKIREDDIHATESEIVELKGYIKEFIEDVENKPEFCVQTHSFDNG